MWTNPTLTAVALGEWLASQPPESVAFLTRADPPSTRREDSSADPIPSSIEERTIRLWFQEGWRWRIETTVDGVPEEYVAVDERWWLWNGSVVTTGESSPAHEEPPHVLPGALAMMLFPDPLLSQLQLSPTGNIVIAGREAADFSATPIDPDHQSWPGAHQYRPALDARSRMLLRLEVLRDGEVLSRSEFVDLETDVDIDAEVFRLDVPADAPVLRTPPREGPRDPDRSRPANWPRVRRPGIRLPRRRGRGN
jgi:hypothetical protein